MGKSSLWAKNPFTLMVSVDLSDGRIDGRHVDAWIVYGTNKQFAVHRTWEDGPYKDNWATTHIRSGSRMQFYSGSRRTAAQRALKIWKACPASTRRAIEVVRFGEKLPRGFRPTKVVEMVALWGKHSELPEATQ